MGAGSQVSRPLSEFSGRGRARVATVGEHLAKDLHAARCASPHPSGSGGRSDSAVEWSPAATSPALPSQRAGRHRADGTAEPTTACARPVAFICRTAPTRSSEPALLAAKPEALVQLAFGRIRVSGCDVPARLPVSKQKRTAVRTWLDEAIVLKTHASAARGVADTSPVSLHRELLDLIQHLDQLWVDVIDGHLRNNCLVPERHSILVLDLLFEAGQQVFSAR